MESISAQFRELYNQADDEGRRKLHEDLRDLQNSMDTEWDVIVRLGSGHLQAALAKIGTDTNIFSMLSASKDSITLAKIADKIGGSPRLIGHILRALAAFRFIEETSRDEFTANRMTHTLANGNVAGAMEHFHAIHGPVALALPSWLRDNKYQGITSNKDLPFQRALETDLEPFEWMKEHPEQMASLGHAMRIQPPSNWVDSYPVIDAVGSFVPDTSSAILVDVGGGFGQQAVAFKTAFPSLPGRIIVQDVPQTLSRAPQVEGIEFQAHDFFTTQPIKHAEFYYLRRIFHDWPDSECIKILKAIIPVMGPESVIVIDEVVVPDAKVPWQVAYMDLTMMSCLGGIERTKSEWEHLLDLAGLTINLFKYDSRMMQSVILAVPK